MANPKHAEIVRQGGGAISKRKKKSNTAVAVQSACKMPALADIDFPLTGRLMIQMLAGEPGLSRKARLYRIIFVRLADKAIREYYLAREALLADIAEEHRSEEEMQKRGREIHFVGFMDHIETCINALSRLFRLLDRIKSEKESPAVPRELRRLVETKSECVASMRNAVEHMDEMIQKDEIAPGKPIALGLNRNRDGVIVSDHEIAFEDLAMVLRNVNEIAQYLLTVKTMPSGGPVVG